MKRWGYVFVIGTLAASLAGCQSQAEPAADQTEFIAGTTLEETTELRMEQEQTSEAMEEIQTEEREAESMRIQVEANGNTILFELNDSQAAKDLYAQLPLTAENEDFSNNEKTFYPPEKLNVNDTPATDGSAGTLAYYEPWGDVVLFYGSFNPNGSLYELGKATSGSEFISEISGQMEISAVE